MAIKMAPVKDSEIKGGKVKIKKPWYDKILKILFILSVIATLIGAFYALAPAAGFIAGFFIYLLGVILVLISVATLFVIWALPGYRNLISKIFTTGSNVFSGATKFKEITANPYPAIMGICAAVIVIFLGLSILLYIKKGKEDINKEHKHKMIEAIILTVMFFICFIISFFVLFKL